MPSRHEAAKLVPIRTAPIHLFECRPRCPRNSTSSAKPSQEGAPSSARSSPFEVATQAADTLERSLQSTLGASKPFACSSAEIALETILRIACEELASCEATVDASSSARLLRGELRLARLSASGLSLAGLRLSTLELNAEDVVIDPGSFLANPPRLPNLVAPVTARFGVRLAQDDINRSPILFSAIQELLREVLRTGVSAAIGETLPRDASSLKINLVRVESLAAGRIVLVADADALKEDGTTLELRGMRVRTTPRASAGQRLILLDKPELVSSFEGFGAKVEVGLPFLRAAGIPLPDAVSIDRITVEDGAMQVDGTVRLQPIDYQELARSTQRLREELQDAAAQQPVTVDVESSPAPDPQSDEAMGKLRSASSDL